MKEVKYFTFLFDRAESADILLSSRVRTFWPAQISDIGRDYCGIRQKNQVILNFVHRFPNFALIDL